MVTFVCTTCGTLNYAHEGQYYAPCCRCGTWFYLQQQQQNPYRYSPPASYSYQQPQAPASMPEPAEYIPKVPANNRYAGHDKVIAKMAKDLCRTDFPLYQSCALASCHKRYAGSESQHGYLDWM